jgi:hypothetical protein
MEPRKWGWAFAKDRSAKAAVARVKKLYSSIVNATHALTVRVALLYHRLPVVRFRVVGSTGFMGEPLESRGYIR